MSEFDTRYIDGSLEGGGHYQLDVDINQISFSHHHLFSREHVLSQRLTQLFEQYVIRQKKNMTEYLGEKVMYILKDWKQSTFWHLLQKRHLLWIPVCIPVHQKPFEKGSSPFHSRPLGSIFFL